ncbi:outer membrane protein assembly factor BamB family protein [Natronorubrum sp. DTA28]|uniref:outer membrane protein assembly factor BamB family protein n=1 Tax=Natronorubrum sp. DTA28 TaxID=3447019 RepID=UPI003F825772
MKRRSILAAVGTALLGGCVDTLSSSGYHGTERGEPFESDALSDWSQPRFDAQNRGFLDNGGIEDKPEVRWEAERSLDGPGFVTPGLVVDGVVIAVDYRSEEVVGFNLETFEEAWVHSIDTPNHRLEYITASDDAVFVTAGNTVYRLPFDEGGRKWEASVHARQTPPVYHTGLLFVAQESGNGKLAAIDAETGDVVWHTNTSQVTPYQPSCAGGSVVTVDAAGHVMSFNTADGDEQWSTQTSLVPAGPPVIGSDVLICGMHDDRGVVERIGLENGNRTEVAYFDEPIESALAYGDSCIYVVDAIGVLHCLDDDLHLQWKYTPDREFRPDAWAERSPIVIGDTVVYVGPDLDIHAVNADTGDHLWTVDFEPVSPASLAGTDSALLLARENSLQIMT